MVDTVSACLLELGRDLKVK